MHPRIIGQVELDRPAIIGQVTRERVEERYFESWQRLRSAVRLRPPRPGRSSVSTQLVVKVTDGALFRRLDRIRHALSAVGNVEAVPDHYLHLPVLDLGRARPTRRLAAAAQHRLADLPPLVIEIARVNAGGGEAFGEIHPPDGLLALNERLAPLLGGHPAPDYLPRFTLGRIVGPVDAAALARAIEWFRDRPIGSVRVERLALARVRRRPFHWIQVVADVPLGREPDAILDASRGDRIVV